MPEAPPVLGNVLKQTKINPKRSPIAHDQFAVFGLPPVSSYTWFGTRHARSSSRKAAQERSLPVEIVPRVPHFQCHSLIVIGKSQTRLPRRRAV
jgi:hypothetical protein